MKPLLAHVYEPNRIPAGVPLYLQPKLNGVRALAGTDNQGRWRFQSRDEIAWDYEVLKHLSKALEELCVPKDWVLDGELYVHGWPLQKINGAITPVRKETCSDTTQVQYHIFDRVDYRLPFIERFQSVFNCLFPQLGKEPSIQIVPTRKPRAPFNSPETFYAAWVSQGYEGMMYRLWDCPYTRPKQLHTDIHVNLPPSICKSKFASDKDNRCWHLLKRKSWCDGEFYCLSVTEGEGKRAGMVGSFNLVSHEGPQARDFSVGSFLGFTDSDLTHLLHNPPIGKKLKIKYLCLSTDGIPLNPTLLAIL